MEKKKNEKMWIRLSGSKRIVSNGIRNMYSVNSPNGMVEKLIKDRTKIKKKKTHIVKPLYVCVSFYFVRILITDKLAIVHFEVRKRSRIRDTFVVIINVSKF